MSHPLEQALGHVFKTPGLLQTALTHRSHSSPHNERLEFLGDSVLNATIARCLFDLFPDLPEGDLSRLRANLVRQDSLHRLARQLSLGNFLRLGEGELKSGGCKRPSILADALEALFGAVWLDAGCEAAGAVISRLYADMLTEITPGQPIKDAKTRLQEWLQGRQRPLPLYELVLESGDDHAKQFVARCTTLDPPLTADGEGTSRRNAEQAAAAALLEKLDISR